MTPDIDWDNYFENATAEELRQCLASGVWSPHSPAEINRVNYDRALMRLASLA